MANRERTVQFSVRLTEEEREHLRSRAAAANCKDVSKFARQMLLHGRIINVDMKPVAELSAQIGREGNNINQIARRMNETREVKQEDIQEVLRLQGEIWRLLKSGLSKLGLMPR